MARRKRNEFTDALLPPITLGVGATTTSIVGGGFDPFIPAGMTNPITTTGSTLGDFVGPVSVISAGGLALKQVQKLEKKTRRRR